MRSCGRAKKRVTAGKPLTLQGRGGGVVSIRGVLPRQVSIGCDGVTMIWSESRTEENVCQYNSLGINLEAIKVDI